MCMGLLLNITSNRSFPSSYTYVLRGRLALSLRPYATSFRENTLVIRLLMLSKTDLPDKPQLGARKTNDNILALFFLLKRNSYLVFPNQQSKVLFLYVLVRIQGERNSKTVSNQRCRGNKSALFSK